jgi:hypothetical protein
MEINALKLNRLIADIPRAALVVNIVLPTPTSTLLPNKIICHENKSTNLSLT